MHATEGGADALVRRPRGCLLLSTIGAGATPFRMLTISESDLRKMHICIPAPPPFLEDARRGMSPRRHNECRGAMHWRELYHNWIGWSAFPVNEGGEGERYRGSKDEHARVTSGA